MALGELNKSKMSQFLCAAWVFVFLTSCGGENFSSSTSQKRRPTGGTDSSTYKTTQTSVANSQVSATPAPPWVPVVLKRPDPYEPIELFESITRHCGCHESFWELEIVRSKLRKNNPAEFPDSLEMRILSGSMPPAVPGFATTDEGRKMLQLLDQLR